MPVRRRAAAGVLPGPSPAAAIPRSPGAAAGHLYLSRIAPLRAGADLVRRLDQSAVSSGGRPRPGSVHLKGAAASKDLTPGSASFPGVILKRLIKSADHAPLSSRPACGQFKPTATDRIMAGLSISVRRLQACQAALTSPGLPSCSFPVNPNVVICCARTEQPCSKA